MLNYMELPVVNTPAIKTTTSSPVPPEFPWKTLIATTGAVVGIVVFFSDQSFSAGSAAASTKHLEASINVLREGVREDFSRFESKLDENRNNIVRMQRSVDLLTTSVEQLVDIQYNNNKSTQQ